MVAFFFSLRKDKKVTGRENKLSESKRESREEGEKKKKKGEKFKIRRAKWIKAGNTCDESQSSCFSIPCSLTELYSVSLCFLFYCLDTIIQRNRQPTTVFLC